MEFHILMQDLIKLKVKHKIKISNRFIFVFIGNQLMRLLYSFIYFDVKVISSFKHEPLPHFSDHTVSSIIAVSCSCLYKLQSKRVFQVLERNRFCLKMHTVACSSTLAYSNQENYILIDIINVLSAKRPGKVEVCFVWGLTQYITIDKLYFQDPPLHTSLSRYHIYFL